MAAPVVIVDTREQLPWTFANVSTVRRALPAGDYSLEGLESQVAVERKTIDDFISTVLHDRIRFKKELHKLSGYRLACVAVEANVADVLAKRYQSEAHPNSVLGFAHAILADYGVPVMFWGSRPEARHTAERFLLLAHKRWASDEHCRDAGTL